MVNLGLCMRVEAASHRWYLPTAGGNGSSSNSPITFSTSDLASFLSNTGETEFIAHFLASTTNYSVGEAITIPSHPSLSSLSITLIGEGARPEAVRLVNSIAPSAESYPNPDYVIKMNLEGASPGSGQAPVNAACIVIENLLIDGNWNWKLDQLTYPERVANYKNSPLNLRARTGAVRKVIVRNFGAVGFAPWTHFGGAAGVETFPVVVGGYDVGQVPPTGWRRPWVVEDCEIHGFNSVRAGYTTLLMAHGFTGEYTPAWAKDDPDRRLVHARNVQYRSEGDGAHVIAMGSAGDSYGDPESGRATFIDSVVLNSSLGYNADTGIVQNVDLVGSMGLNVWWWANVYTTAVDWRQNFGISSNAVRFGPQADYPSYRVFCWNSGGTAYTDPALVLGRKETNTLFALVRAGTFDGLRIEHNWLTTLQGVHFDETGGGATNGLFRLLYKVPDSSGASCETRPTSYPAGTDLTVGPNLLSDYAHDFIPGGTSLTTNFTYASITAGSTNAVQTARTVLQSVELGFRPAAFGRTTRVLPVVSTNTRTFSWKTGTGTSNSAAFSDPVLVGAWELSMEEPAVGATNVSLPVRIVKQTTPASGITTQYGDGKLVWLSASGLVSASQSTTADGVGEASFNIPINSGENGEIFVTIFHDPRATNGASGSFSEYEVAHSKGTIKVGTVVSVEPSIPFAVDRREGGVQAGQFRFTRSGSIGSSLMVQFSLGDCANSPSAASLTTDYTISAVSPASLTSTGSVHTITFASGQRTAELTVTPVADEVIERELVCLTVEPEDGYVPSEVEGSASIFIYDGPEWTLYEVTHSQYPDLGETYGVGLSNDEDGEDVPTPMIAANFFVGRIVEVAPSDWEYGEGIVGGGWFDELSDPEYFWEESALPEYSPVVTGVSDEGLGANFSGYIKESSGQTRALLATESTWSYLDIPSSGWLAEGNRALCISPNSYYVGGYAMRTQTSPSVTERQPVAWVSTFTFQSLFSGSGLNASRGGEALAVNDQGEFVGHRVLQVGSSSVYIPRAFRSRQGAAEVLSTDLLIPPDQTPSVPDDEVPSEARAINARSGSNSGTAAGWATWDPSDAVQVLPVIWWRRPNGAGEVTDAAWVPIAHSEGQVNAITADQELFGQVSGAGGTNPKAWHWKNGWSLGHGFEDKAFVYGYSTDWTLEEVVGVSEKRLLIGNGTLGGLVRAFLLVPQPDISVD